MPLPLPPQRPKRNSLSLDSKNPGRPAFDWESKVGRPGIWVGGLDEVGRGCLAGPVVAAAFVLPRASGFEELLERFPELSQLHDSKLLSETKREELSEILWARVAEGAFFASIRWACAREIDELNILWASLEAMTRAAIHVESEAAVPVHWLVDGNRLPTQLEQRSTAVIKGDQLSIAIAGASILAKVYRDRWMSALQRRDPRFDYGRHKGYPTPQHQTELRQHAPTTEHRTTFAPVRDAWKFHQRKSKKSVGSPKTSF